MAQINVVTTKEEQEAVLEALDAINGEIVPVSKIADVANLPYSRARYALLDLIEAGKVEKVPHRNFNKHYVRYSYIIL